MSEPNRATDFMSTLLLSLVQDAHFVALESSATYLYKQDMGAVSTVCLHLLNERSAEGVAVHMTNFVEKNRPQPGTHVFHYYLYVAEDLACYREEILPLLQKWQETCLDQRILIETVVLDLESGSYQTLSGQKIPDRSLRSVLEQVLEERGADEAAQRQVLEKKTQSFQAWRESSSPVQRTQRRGPNPVTFLLFTNVLVYFAGWIMSLSAGNQDWFMVYGIQDNELIRQGEVWRLVTSMFLHADVAHLFGNMLFLVYLGRVLLRYYRDGVFWIFYLVSGFAGNLLGFFCTDYLSLGASGAIMGLGGVLIYRIFFGADRRSFRRRGNFFVLGLMVLYNLFAGLWQTDIDNYGHFGGFLAGFLLAILYAIWQRSRKRSQA